MNVKKFVAVGASMLCAAVMADGSVQSSNIVGYQEITIPNGQYTMFTMTFEGVAGAEYDCRDIVVLNSAGEVMNDDNTVTPSRRSRNKVIFQKLNPSTGALDSTNYKFSTQNSKGWCEESKALTDGQLTFKSGEGIYIQNNQGEDVKFRFSGEVKLAPISMELANGTYTIVGNMTPVPVDVKAIKVLNSAGLEMNDDNTVTPSRRSRNKVIFQKLNPDTGALFATNYKFSTQNSKGWCEESTPLAEKALILQPGECVYIQNNQGDSVYLQFPTSVTAQ